MQLRCISDKKILLQASEFDDICQVFTSVEVNENSATQATETNLLGSIEFPTQSVQQFTSSTTASHLFATSQTSTTGTVQHTTTGASTTNVSTIQETTTIPTRAGVSTTISATMQQITTIPTTMSHTIAWSTKVPPMTPGKYTTSVFNSVVVPMKSPYDKHTIYFVHFNPGFGTIAEGLEKNNFCVR